MTGNFWFEFLGGFITAVLFGTAVLGIIIFLERRR